MQCQLEWEISDQFNVFNSSAIWNRKPQPNDKFMFE